MRFKLVLYFLCFVFSQCNGQFTRVRKPVFTHADSLRGSINPNRAWWNVLRYDLEVEPDFLHKTIRGRNTIKFRGRSGNIMQIDLQQPLVVDSILIDNKKLVYKRNGNVCLVNVGEALKNRLDDDQFISVYYHGRPLEAANPPWDGGWIWERDTLGRPWMSVACQGIGASVWYPCKDHQSDEPDEGASLTMIVPDTLVAVANGRLTSKIDLKGTTMYRWEVKNPINSYDLIPYIGGYQNFTEVYNGEDGPLSCSYWVLDYNVPKAREQFKQVKPMLSCFEYWFGPYPFYEDGYKLVESPHLGMEHQSAVAYGNHFMNGYLGKDLSGTGWGTLWDFIIIHESGHEWFGNSITSNDIADMWIHEGFTNYSEALFTECQYGLRAAQEYEQGIRKNIRNDRPITGFYGVNHEGSGDMYSKASNMIHTIRTIINNDSLFRDILRGLNKEFYHKTVDARQVEKYISSRARIDFSLLFQQYLRTTSIPVVGWKISKNKMRVRLSNCINNLTMKMWIPLTTETGTWKELTCGKWITVETNLTEEQADFLWDKNFYVEYRALNP